MEKAAEEQDKQLSKMAAEELSRRRGWKEILGEAPTPNPHPQHRHTFPRLLVVECLANMMEYLR